MSIEYLVLRADAEDGPFAGVTAHKLNQSWETLQEALDELGQQGWDLCTTITAPRENTGVLESIIARGLFSNAWPPQPKPWRPLKSAPSSLKPLKSWRGKVTAANKHSGGWPMQPGSCRARPTTTSSSRPWTPIWTRWRNDVLPH